MTLSIKHLFFIPLSIFISCGNPATSPNEAGRAKTLTREDSLYKEVIGYHDEAMPKMGKLIGYQKSLKAKLDSLGKMAPSKMDKSSKELVLKYEQMLSDLKKAEKEMNDWMDSFNPDPKFPSKEDLEKYWTDQQQKAKKMRDDMLRSIDSAKATVEK
jgi:hypothetical protein